jgi:flagellar biosynthesis/type III secretory pathway protein FliH
MKEGFAKGRAEGREAGLAEGFAKGRVEAAVKLVPGICEKRFGPLSVALKRRIKKLPLERLDDLALTLLDLPNKSALIVWLDSQEQPQ